MTYRRAQAPELPISAGSLNPAAVPADSFVQPGRPADDDTMQHIAASLGFFNQNLAQLSQGMQAQRLAERDTAADEKAERQRTFLNMSTKEQRAEVVRTGKIGDDDLVNAQLHRMAGSADGGTWLANGKEFLGTQNLNDMDVDTWITEQADAYLSTTNGDPYIAGGFSQHVASLRSWAHQERSRQSAEERDRFTRDTSYQHLRTELERWAEAGVTVNELPRLLGDFYSQVGAGGTRLLTEDDMDRHTIGLAAMLAEANPEYAEALVSFGREDAEGNISPSLAHRPDFAPQAANILRTADRTVREREVQSAFAERRRENLEKAANEDYTTFEELEVHGQKLTASEQEAWFLQDLDRTFAVEVDAGRLTEGRKFDATVDLAGGTSLCPSSRRS